MIFGQIDQYIKIVIYKRNCKSVINVYIKKISEIVNYSVNEGLCIHHETFGNIVFFCQSTTHLHNCYICSALKDWNLI